MNKDKKGYLILADGTILEGRRFGAERDSIGELVFTTGVEGYVETLTDPSYCGQIVMQTFPLIGNYGMMEEDFEGKCALKGYVVREYCDTPSNFRSEYDLDTFLKNNDVPGIWGIDTRALTRKIREHGVMNAVICSEIPENLDAVKEYMDDIYADYEKIKKLAKERKEHRCGNFEKVDGRTGITLQADKCCAVAEVLGENCAADELLLQWADYKRGSYQGTSENGTGNHRVVQ